MREQREEFSKLGVRLALVVQGTAAEAVRFCGRHGVVELCIPDPEKESYRAMGFFRTSFREILFPSAELRKRRAEAADAGCRVSLKGAFQKHSDVLQLPGAALVGKGGRVLWLHRGAHTADLPSVAELLRSLREHLGSGQGR